MTQISILLADDHSLILQGMCSLLADHYHVVGKAEDGKTLVEMAEKLRPEIVVLDVSMPLRNGIDAAREILSLLPHTRLIFISMHSNPIYVRKAIEAGASAYVLKSGATEELLKAIETVSKGGTYWSPGLHTESLDDLPASSAAPSRSVEMTTRQRQILQLIAEGKQNKEIASVLGVSVKTVEFHRGRLIHKLGARNVAELTRIALQEGLIDPNP